MNLLFCIKSMNCAGGGAERVLAEVASGLAARGHEVMVLSFDRPGGESFYPLHGSIRRIELGIGATDDRSGLLDILTRIIAMRFEISRCSPDVVIGFMHSTFVPLSLSMLGSGIQFIASEHIVYEHYKRFPLQKLLLLLTSRLIPTITCTSSQALLSYPQFIRRKMVAINNPVKIEASSHAHVLGVGAARKLLLTVGRLEAQKDHAVLLEAFSKIAEKVPDWDLRIVGEGALRSRLERQASALGLGNRVQLPGATKDIAKEYLSAQLFVVPSRYESFGLATAEALAHGLPVVGFADCAGTNQLVQPGENGFLVEGDRDRVGSLATALDLIMTDDPLRLRLSRSSNCCLRRFGLEEVLDCWERLLERTVARPLPNI
jgi:glycosyltransferase involved in cell wall biosynthesis